MMRLFRFAVPLTLFIAALPVSSLASSRNLLKASRHSPIVQNKRADSDDLSRMRDVAMINRFVRAGLLVTVPSRTKHYYTRYIPAKYRYIRPWSKLFLDRLSAQYYARFKKKLRITSTVRSIALQNSIRKRNRNAASPYGPKRSSHLTGATLDISKAGMKSKEIAWMRSVLHSIKAKGYLYAVEEFQQPTFHIMVFKSYPKYVASLKRRQGRKQATD